MRSLSRCFFIVAALWLTQPLYVLAQTPAAVVTDSKSVTPSTPGEHPDLNGVWTQRYDGGPGSSGRVDPKDVSADGKKFSFPPCCGGSRLGGLYTAEQDGRVLGKGDRNKPVYKAE